MVIQPYNPAWPLQFEKLKRELRLHIAAPHRIHHVGSTAIPGMYAKPIIDIDIEMTAGAAFEPIRGELEKIGYQHEGNLGIAGREAFMRRDGEHGGVLDSIQHHLYVGGAGATELARHRLFRDYLRTHGEYVKKYIAIKMAILKHYGEDDRAKYVEAKEHQYRWFFEEVIRKSREESKQAEL